MLLSFSGPKRKKLLIPGIKDGVVQIQVTCSIKLLHKLKRKLQLGQTMKLRSFKHNVKDLIEPEFYWWGVATNRRMKGQKGKQNGGQNGSIGLPIKWNKDFCFHFFLASNCVKDIQSWLFVVALRSYLPPCVVLLIRPHLFLAIDTFQQLLLGYRGY